VTEHLKMQLNRQCLESAVFLSHGLFVESGHW
jgi:hypothetical protein